MNTIKLNSYAAAYDQLKDLLEDIPESSWKFRPSTSAWSIHEIIIHLADMEINGHIRLLKALAEPGGSIMPLDQEAWTAQLFYHEQDPSVSLQLFKLLRIKTTRLLESIPADKCSNFMYHPEGGYISVSTWLNNYEQHARLHLEQIRRVYHQWQQQFHTSFWKERGILAGDGFYLEGQQLKLSAAVYKSLQVPLPENDWELVKKTARHKELEIFMLITATIQLLLYKYTSHKNIIIHLPALCVNNEEGAYPAQLIPLITDINKNSTLEEFAIYVNTLILSSYKYQDYPLTDTAASNVMVSADALHGVVELTHDVHFKITDKGIVIHYDSNIFGELFITRFTAHLAYLFRYFREPAITIGSIEIYTPSERNELLLQGTGPAVPYNTAETLDVAIRQVVEMRGDAPAIICEGRVLSYTALNERSDRLARYLIDVCHVKRGDAIGILMSRNEQFVIALLGIIKAGCAYVPLDAGNPAVRLQHMLNSCNAVALVSESDYILSVPDFNGQIVALDIQTEELARYHPFKEQISSPGDPAYIIYTSGSTGIPKGVSISHRSLLNTQHWRRKYYNFTHTDRSLQVAPFYFDSSVNDVFTMLLCGGSLVISTEKERMDMHSLSECIATYGITHFNMVPGLYRTLLPALKSNDNNLRVITLAGERLSRELLQTHFKAFPDIEVVNEYGPTENAICSTAKSFKTLPEKGEPSIGHPITNTQVYVLGEEQELLPPGVTGEICLSGAGLSNGYLNNPGNTPFIVHPFEADKILYRTGDLGRWLPNGELEYAGRRDDQVKIRGQRVELREIVAVLEAYDGITAAAVVLLNDQLVAYICGPENTAGVKAFLLTRLPAHMVPQHYVIIPSLPLTGAGKLDKKALPLPTEEMPDNHSTPTDTVERMLCEIWCSVLNRSTIGVRDDFFMAGGDSLKAIQIVSLLQGQGYQIEVTDIFEYPQIQSLAGVLRQLSVC